MIRPAYGRLVAALGDGELRQIDLARRAQVSPRRVRQLVAAGWLSARRERATTWVRLGTVQDPGCPVDDVLDVLEALGEATTGEIVARSGWSRWTVLRVCGIHAIRLRHGGSDGDALWLARTRCLPGRRGLPHA